jgi:hypothetical protein
MSDNDDNKTAEQFEAEEREQEYRCETTVMIEHAIIAVLDERDPGWRDDVGWSHESHGDDLSETTYLHWSIAVEDRSERSFKPEPAKRRRFILTDGEDQS